jgi:REP element-mobilizing transposase RayT
MPWGLKRNQQTRDLHFITFSCYHRQPLLASASAKGLFQQALGQTRRQYGFWVSGYVVMPEHVHLLLSAPGTCGSKRRLASVEAVGGPPADRRPPAFLADALLRF